MHRMSVFTRNLKLDIFEGISECPIYFLIDIMLLFISSQFIEFDA